jgi:hypothetical protein
MKFKAIWSFLLIIASGYAYGQACPRDSVIFDASTLPGGVLPTGDTVGRQISVGSRTSGYISASATGTTQLIAEAPSDSLSEASIVFSDNFSANISTGLFTASIQACGDTGVSIVSDPPVKFSPAPLPASSSLLLVYPTVSTGSVTITGSAANLANAAIVVFDETGRTVYSLYNEAATTLYLPLGNLSTGIYFVQIRQPSKVTTQKIIIMK